jgi:PAS domain S-box-containing protein
VDTADARELYFERHPDPMWLFDLESLAFLDVNAAATEKYGWSREEFRRMTIRDIRPPADVPALAEAVATHRSVRTESGIWRHLTRDGRVLHVDIVATDVVHDGRAARLVCARDVTRLVELDARLGETVDLLRIAGRTAKLGGWRVDLAAGVVDWSAETAAIHELPGARRMAIADGINFYAPESLPRINAVWEACARNGTPFDEVLRIVTARGRRVWVRTIGEPEFDAAGRVVAVHGAFQDVSELVAAREESAALSRRLLSTLESIADGFYTLDAEWRVTFANLHAEEMLGVRRGELIGRRIWDTFPAAVGTPFEEEFRRAVADRRSTRFTALYAPFGRWYEVNAYPGPDGLAIYFRDCTAERARDDQLRLLEMAVSRVNDVLLITEAEPVAGPDGPKIVYVNDAFVRLTGYSPEEAIGKTPRILQGAKTDRAELDRIRHALERWQPIRTELVNYTKDGREYWAEIEILPIADATGWYTHWVAVQRDVTEQKRAAAAILESEERFRLVAAATNDVVWDYDCLSDRMWWGSGLRTVLGYGSTDGIAEPDLWSRSVHDEDRARVVAGYQAVLAGPGTQWSDEYRMVRSDGRVIRVVDGGSVIRDADGRAVRMVGALRDVTERRELDERLRQSQKLEAVGQLTGGIAHDFNNLLTVILGNAELLGLQLREQPDARRAADTIVHAAGRGAELTKRLLAFARRQALQPRVIDVGQLVAGMDALLRRTLSESIDIAVSRAGDAWTVEVDPVQLETAILNLAINARDAMPHGGQLAITIANAVVGADDAERNDVRPGDYVCVAVTDTGHGMPADVVAQAFEPFFTTKEVGKGSGLGLSMVYGFVTQSGGHARIESREGEGTTVSLFLPRAGAPVTADTPDMAATLPTGDEHVLVVEDDELVREFATALLTALGYRVSAAANGPEALEFLGRDPTVQLLFTDVVMPGGMNGRELATAARRIRPTLPVLLTSGYMGEGLVHAGRVDRDLDLLGKPYRQDALAAKVRAVLDARTAAPARSQT